MNHSDVVYKFLNKYGFADTRAAEKTYFAAFRIWCEKVYYFYARFEYLRRRRFRYECGRVAVYACARNVVRERRAAVDRVAEYVEHSAEDGFADRYFYTRVVAFDRLTDR